MDDMRTEPKIKMIVDEWRKIARGRFWDGVAVGVPFGFIIMIIYDWVIP